MSKAYATRSKQIELEFRLEDILGDGLITASQVRKALFRLGEVVQESIINEYDAGMCGVFNLEGFMNIVQAHSEMNKVSEKQLVDALVAFDRSGTEQVDTDGLVEIFKSINEKLTPQEVKEIMRLAGGSCEGDKLDIRKIARNLFRSL